MPSYCLISTDGIQATNDLLILGDNLDIQADNVNIITTNSNISLIFALFNDSGRKLSTSSPLNVTTADFEQGSNVNLSMALPTTLETGTYTVEFHYYVTAESARTSTPIDCESGVLNVVGHLAKFNSRFTIDDVTLKGKEPKIPRD